ncbi:MAG: metallophosphoesterase [Ketobacter sp.]
MMLEPSVEGYDIIGDVHGCAPSLIELLQKLGYTLHDGVWHNPGRKAVFVGDILDRGPNIRDAMQLVINMVNAGQAHLVLGNHEYNAIAYSTLSFDHVDARLRRHYRRLGFHLRQTLKDYRYHLQEWKDVIGWLRQRPLFLEFDHFRVVHACWDQARIDQASDIHQSCVLLDDDFLAQSLLPATEPNRIIERLLKGTDMALPDGQTMLGSDGVRRSRFRTKFWSPSPKTLGDVIFQPDQLPHDLMSTPLSDRDRARLFKYGPSEKPLFVGHYWCKGTPAVIRDNLACLDYSAVKNGLLVAYRMGTQARLNNQDFISVESNPG